MCLVTQSCPALLPYELPGSSVLGILQASVLEWVAMPYFRGPSRCGIKARSPGCRQILHPLSPQGSPQELMLLKYCIEQMQNTVFSSAHSTFTKTGDMLAPKSSLNKFKRIKILDFPSRSVVMHLPASVGDTGSIPGPGSFHMLQRS